VAIAAERQRGIRGLRPQKCSSRQRTECLKWTNRSYWIDEDKWMAYKERVKQLLKAGHAENKCDVYLEAHNLYKLAYIRQHYPDQYSKILIIK